MDVYKGMKPDRPDAHYVRVGHITAVVSIVVAVVLAQPLLGGLESAFQTLEEYTGFIAPGVTAAFLLGMFWKPTTSTAAMAMLIVSILANIAMKFGAGDMAFVIRAWVVFLACLATGFIVSKVGGASPSNEVVDLKSVDFSTSTSFKVASFLTILVLVALYAIFW